MDQIVFRKFSLINSMTKILSINFSQIERLKPKLLTNGILFTFTIAVDSNEYDNILKLISNVVENEQLRAQISKVYNLSKPTISSVTVEKLKDLYSNKTNTQASSVQSINISSNIWNNYNTRDKYLPTMIEVPHRLLSSSSMDMTPATSMMATTQIDEEMYESHKCEVRAETYI